MISTATVVVPMPLNFTIIVVLAGALYVVATIILQRKLMNPLKQLELQEKIKGVSNELGSMIKSNASKEAIAAKQKEVTPLMMESMKMSFKPMLVIFPLFFIVWLVILPTFLQGGSAYVINFVEPLHYKGLFFVTALILGMGGSIGLMIRDRSVHKKRMRNAALQTQQSNASTADKTLDKAA